MIARIFLFGFVLGVVLATMLPIQAAAPAAVADPAKAIEAAREQRIKWWREARFGMFIHWGLYSIPAGTWKNHVHASGYSEWIMFDEKIPAKEYALLAGKFNPVKFDAKAWAAVAKKAGMKYLVLTTKHHDGFSMFKPDLTPYNIVAATPFKRDVTQELNEACHHAGLRFGCYYSVDRDWYRPLGPGKSELAGKKIKAVRMLGSKARITWRQTDDGLMLSVPREKPCRYAFVYQIVTK